MKKVLVGLWRWSFRRGAGFDCSSSCLGTLGLTILISQKLWREWTHVPVGMQSLKDMSFWLYALALLAVYCLEAWQLRRRLKAKGYSPWWTLPLVVIVLGLATSPPTWQTAHGVLSITFIALQIPLFIDGPGEYGDEAE